GGRMREEQDFAAVAWFGAALSVSVTMVWVSGLQEWLLLKTVPSIFRPTVLIPKSLVPYGELVQNLVVAASYVPGSFIAAWRGRLDAGLALVSAFFEFLFCAATIFSVRYLISFPWPWAILGGIAMGSLLGAGLNRFSARGAAQRGH